MPVSSPQPGDPEARQDYLQLIESLDAKPPKPIRLTAWDWLVLILIVFCIIVVILGQLGVFGPEYRPF